MRALEAPDLRRLRDTRNRWGDWDALTQPALDELEAAWSRIAGPGERDAAERFALALPDGSTPGPHGPRWLFHLLGIPHRAAHIGLRTPNGLIVIQRRSATRTDWPDAWDMAVAGHVPQDPAGAPLTFEQAAWKEAGEEIGLEAAEAHLVLAEGRLTAVGPPVSCFDRNLERNPPFHNAEVRQLYAATLTAEGLARVHPDHEEVSGLHLCTVEEAWALLEGAPIASGLRHSLPRYLDWLAQCACDANAGRV